MVNGEHLWLLLKGVADGSLSPRAALQAALGDPAPTPSSPPPAAPGTPPEVVIDLQRPARCGFPEVVYAPGKSVGQILDVFRAQQTAGQASLATRCTPDQIMGVKAIFPQAVSNDLARTLRLTLSQPLTGRVVVVTAGTTDRPVAEEACETLRWMGVQVELILDVGVAGPQRFLERRHLLTGADVVIVVAGMEGALPSVVAGWVDVPVIGVPTSVGYGVAFGGVSALLSMLNSCAANVTVVNIDGGFKAGYLAGLIARRVPDNTPPAAAASPDSVIPSTQSPAG